MSLQLISAAILVSKNYLSPARRVLTYCIGRERRARCPEYHRLPPPPPIPLQQRRRLEVDVGSGSGLARDVATLRPPSSPPVSYTHLTLPTIA